MRGICSLSFPFRFPTNRARDQLSRLLLQRLHDFHTGTRAARWSKLFQSPPVRNGGCVLGGGGAQGGSGGVHGGVGGSPSPVIDF